MNHKFVVGDSVKSLFTSEKDFVDGTYFLLDENVDIAKGVPCIELLSEKNDLPYTHHHAKGFVLCRMLLIEKIKNELEKF